MGCSTSQVIINGTQDPRVQTLIRNYRNGKDGKSDMLPLNKMSIESSKVLQTVFLR